MGKTSESYPKFSIYKWMFHKVHHPAIGLPPWWKPLIEPQNLMDWFKEKMAGKPWKTPCLMGKSMVSGFDFPLINPLLHRKIQSCPLQTPSSAPPLRLRPFLAARRSLLRRASAMGSALGLAGLHLWMKDFQGGINMIDTGWSKFKQLETMVCYIIYNMCKRQRISFKDIQGLELITSSNFWYQAWTVEHKENHQVSRGAKLHVVTESRIRFTIGPVIMTQPPIFILSPCWPGTDLLEVPTFFEAYFWGLCKGISPQNMALLILLLENSPGISAIFAQRGHMDVNAASISLTWICSTGPQYQKKTGAMIYSNFKSNNKH